MACEADLVTRTAQTETLVAASAIGKDEIWQLPSGKAGVKRGQAAAVLDTASFYTQGIYRITKTTGIVLHNGDEVFWDHSANSATYKKEDATRDYYLGTATADAASADTDCTVELNNKPKYTLDLARDEYYSTPVGTQALGGLGVYQRGGAIRLVLDSTSEAQKVEAISAFGVDPDANAIVTGAFWIESGSGAAADLNIGLANATHATDADSITESLFIHVDGASTDILAESDDGTTEVAATDTTINLTEGAGNLVYFKFVLRSLSDIEVYINGAQVLTGTTFRLDAATGPLYLLAHLEKTTGTNTMVAVVNHLRMRTADQ